MKSIEFRLTAWYAAMLFAGFVGLGAVLWVLVRHSIQASIDDRLAGRMERLMETMHAEAKELLEEPIASGVDDDELAQSLQGEFEEDLLENTLALPESALSRIRTGDGRELFPLSGIEARVSWPRAFDSALPFTSHAEERSFRVLVQDVTFLDGSYSVLLATPLTIVDDVRERVVTSVLVITPIALVLCSMGGFSIAKHALRPVNELTSAAAEITVGNLSRRIPTRGTGDSLERLAMTFNTMLERLEASVTKLEQFASDASHELRTPISVIRTTAELAVRHGREIEDYRTDLQQIQAEAERLSELVEILLSLARNGVAGTQVPMSDLNLAALAAAVSSEFAGRAEQKGLVLEMRSSEEPALVRGNEASLRRLVGSLLDNALAYTTSGSIRVGVEQDAGGVSLQVADTGEGIPDSAFEKVFDRFYRVDPSRSRTSGGLGLGLSIAKRIAELHGADILVSSRLGEGTVFTVRFPKGET